MSDRSPFLEDLDAHKVADRLGFSLTRRYEAIEVTDERALQEAGYCVVKPKPDYSRIAEALRTGVEVPGARFRAMEYILRPRGER